MEELPEAYRLTRKGTLFVDNIYFYMLDDQERAMVNREMKTIIFD